MTADTIFRLYSMSKPITSVAAMMLVDDGKLRLDDPLAKYVPVFADVKVGVERTDASGSPWLMLEPLKRPITIEDLLRHTSGLTYGFSGGAVGSLLDKAGLQRGNPDIAELTERISKLPLAAQPGTLWDYSYSTDVLGRVIEVVTGQTLFDFEKQRLLDPLGMSDTAFYLAYRVKGALIAQPLREERARMSDPLRWQRLQSGGIGMIGTVGDYARFAQMLLNGGTLGGKRYLKPGTVALMTSDHIGPETKIGTMARTLRPRTAGSVLALRCEPRSPGCATADRRIRLGGSRRHRLLCRSPGRHVRGLHDADPDAAYPD